MEQGRTAVIIDLLRLGAFLVRQGNRQLRELEIGQQEFVVLHAISAEQPINHTRICSELLFERSNVSKIVGRLIEQGLVETTSSETDRREKLLRVSSKGRRKVALGMAIFDDWNERWLAPLSKAQLAATSKNLKRLLSLC